MKTNPLLLAIIFNCVLFNPAVAQKRFPDENSRVSRPEQLSPFPEITASENRRQTIQKPHAVKVSRADAPVNDDPCQTIIDTLTAGETINWTGTFSESDGEVFQAFTISTCANIVLDFCGSSSTFSSDYFFIYDGQCDTAVNFYYANSNNIQDCAKAIRRLNRYACAQVTS